MAEHVALSEIPIGSSALLRSFPATGTAFLRLREMGLLPGTKLTLIRTAPMGDPLEIKVRGYNLTLRRSESDQILVERILP
jgi:ferrous iron transport protein A